MNLGIGQRYESVALRSSETVREKRVEIKIPIEEIKIVRTTHCVLVCVLILTVSSNYLLLGE